MYQRLLEMINNARDRWFKNNENLNGSYAANKFSRYLN